MTRTAYISCICCIQILLSACNQPFEPKGPYEEKLVVFGVLSTHTDTQYVRLYTTYNPNGFDPQTNSADKQVEGAAVTLSGNGGTKLYRDTTILRMEKSRYSSDIHAYVLNPFVPTPGTTYTLHVQLPTGKGVGGTVLVPDKGFLSFRPYNVLDRPGSYNEDLRILAEISPKTRGILVRLFLEFEISRNGTTERKTVEVPSRIREFSGTAKYEVFYPALQRRTSFVVNNSYGVESVVFQRGAYLKTLDNLYRDYKDWNVSFLRAIFVLTQAEVNLYNYYNIVNGFRDEISIRSDEPDFSSIDGGIGIFGAMTVDTLYYSYRSAPR